MRDTTKATSAVGSWRVDWSVDHQPRRSAHGDADEGLLGIVEQVALGPGNVVLITIWKDERLRERGEAAGPSSDSRKRAANVIYEDSVGE